VAYDTIIIGAGMSGLAAGIRLAYYDKSVCILERHTTIGGLNSFYRLRHRNYDVGLHAVTNYADPGTKTGPLSKLLRQLRLRWEDFDLRPQTESSIVFPGRILRFTNNFAVLFNQITEQFPKQADNMRRLLNRIDEHDPLNLNRKAESGRAVVSSYISDPLLVDMLFCPLMFYGSATARDMDFSQFVIMFKSIFYEGFGRPFQGIRLILKKLVRHFRSFGGELFLRSGVKHIEHQSDRVTSVVLDDGRVLEAKNVLSSAGSAETMRLCSQPVSKDSVQPGDISFMESISVLDKQPIDLGHKQTIVFYNDNEKFTYDRPSRPLDLRSGIICSPNNFQYDDQRQLDDGRIRITALADHEYWMNLSDEEYAEQKVRWQDQLVEAALKFMPDFRPHVIDSDVFTPRTIKRFTGHLNGCVYGAPQKFVNGRTHLDNLFVCGTDQGFLGIIGAMLSGITIANNYLLKS
jgi:phytoene dehydrogenase-like protein